MNPSLLIGSSDKTESFTAGKHILEQGRHSYVMFIVLEGTVEIQINGVTVEAMGRGGVFGEMSLVDPAPCSATVVAISDTRVAPVDKRHFTLLVQEHPEFALHLLGTMAERLRRMDQRTASP